MFKSYFDAEDAIGPEELKLIQDVFDTAVEQRGIAHQGPDAEALAAHVISVFKGGFHSREELLHVLSDQGIELNSPGA